MADNRDFVQGFMNEGGSPVYVEDKKLSEISTKTAIASEGVMLKGTDGAYYEIDKASLSEVIRAELGAILAVVIIFWNKIWPFGKKGNKAPLSENGIGAWIKTDIFVLWRICQCLLLLLEPLILTAMAKLMWAFSRMLEVTIILKLDLKCRD